MTFDACAPALLWASHCGPYNGKLEIISANGITSTGMEEEEMLFWMQEHLSTWREERFLLEGRRNIASD